MAFLAKRSRGSKKTWFIRWLDSQSGKYREISCESKGATNTELRKKLLKQYETLEKQSKEDYFVHGLNKRAHFTMTEAFEEYLSNRNAEVQIRKLRGGKEGLAVNSYTLIEYSMKDFKEYCKVKKIFRCKDLTPKMLLEFKKWLQLNYVKNSTATLNLTLRNVKTFINSFKIEKPPMFDDIPALVSALKQFPTDSISPYHFKVNELQLIFRSALRRDSEQCKDSREKHANWKNFNGRLPLKNVPILPTLILVTLTGMRIGEALKLKWCDVDLDSGVFEVKAQKTNRTRLIPLIDTIHGKISDSLFSLLRIWKLKANSEFVLPHPLSDKPSEIQHPLEKFKKAINLPTLNFQNLRKNFVSYVISSGVPPAVCAFWAGHSPAVAEKNYLSYSIGMLNGTSIEENMGISEILKDAIAGYKGQGEFQKLQLTKWCA